MAGSPKTTRSKARDQHLRLAHVAHLLIRAIFCLSVLEIVGCKALAVDPPLLLAEVAVLERVNSEVNRRAIPCPHDYCLDRWPDTTDLKRIANWDCKAYAVAKADRLMRDYGYTSDRLEYVLISGPSLRVTHAVLLVDGRWVLDQGLRCQVCPLERFTAGVVVTGRIPIEDLHFVIEAQRH